MTTWYILYFNLFQICEYQRGSTPFHSAAIGGHENIVKILLEAGANVNLATADVSCLE